MIDFKLLNSQLPVRRVLDALGLRCHSVYGTHWRGKCPIHQSGSVVSRSFEVFLGQGRYYCHKCKATGDLINLWAHVRGLRVFDAARQLEKEFQR